MMNLLKKVFNYFKFNKNIILGGETLDDLDRNIYNISRKYKVSILPITPNFDIENLYPLIDHVELWNIFIVGNDKTYLLANIIDPHMKIPRVSPSKAASILPKDLENILDSIWTKTLSGKQLQFYMVWSSRLYFLSTYPFLNGKSKVSGAILFMRAFENMPKRRFATTVDGCLVPLRYSSEEHNTSPKG